MKTKMSAVAGAILMTVTVVLGMTVGAGASSAETVVSLGAGDRIGFLGDGLDLCTVAAVGYDSHGNKVALTAGHCVVVGQPMTKLKGVGLVVPSGNRVLIGTGAVSKMTVQGVGQTNRFDYGFIKLNDDVQLQGDFSGVAAPRLGLRLVRVGNDAGIPTRNYDSVVGFTQRDFTFTGLIAPGASGGPLFVGTQLVGIASRAGVFWGVPLNVAQRVDAAIDDATAAGGVGAGFQSI